MKHHALALSLALFAACSDRSAAAQTHTPHAPPHASTSSTPAAIPGTSSVPGLRAEWFIAPATTRVDPRYTASTLATPRAVGRGFPAPTVGVRVTLRLHNTTAQPIEVGDGSGSHGGWGLVLTGPGATQAESGTGCWAREMLRLARPVIVPAGGFADITNQGLTDDGGVCANRAWYWTAPGTYTLTGALRTVHGAPGAIAGRANATAVSFALPTMTIDVRP